MPQIKTNNTTTKSRRGMRVIWHNPTKTNESIESPQNKNVEKDTRSFVVVRMTCSSQEHADALIFSMFARFTSSTTPPIYGEIKIRVNGQFNP